MTDEIVKARTDALIIACKNRDIEMIKWLLENGTSPNTPVYYIDHKSSFLENTIKSTKNLQSLIWDCDVEKQSYTEKFDLEQSAINILDDLSTMDREDKVEILLSSISDKEIPTEYDECVIDLFDKNDKECYLLFIKYKADINLYYIYKNNPDPEFISNIIDILLEFYKNSDRYTSNYGYIKLNTLLKILLNENEQYKNFEKIIKVIRINFNDLFNCELNDNKQLELLIGQGFTFPDDYYMYNCLTSKSETTAHTILTHKPINDYILSEIEKEYKQKLTYGRLLPKFLERLELIALYCEPEQLLRFPQEIQTKIIDNPIHRLYPTKAIEHNLTKFAGKIN